jgi:plastocyanin
VRTLAGIGCLLVLCSCGGGSPSSPSGAGGGGGGGGATITITSSGVSTADLTVSPGTRVTFRNNDARPHNMTSDPHPDHQDCQEINAVGVLQPGQSRETANLNTVRTCGFHDHDDPPPGGNRWTGRITIR